MDVFRVTHPGMRYHHVTLGFSVLVKDTVPWMYLGLLTRPPCDIRVFRAGEGHGTMDVFRVTHPGIRYRSYGTTM